MSDREVPTRRAHVLDARITVAGEPLLLCPELAVYRAGSRTLLVADTHFGKSATFRAEGLPVPHGTTADALGRLDALRDRLDVQRLVILGDFLHAAQGRTPGTLDALRAWRDRWSAVDMLLVRGNHDRHAGDPPAELEITCVTEPHLQPPFAFAHRPKAVPDSYVLAGHLHPGASLWGAGRQRMRLPCFWFREDIGVLPAFGHFTGRSEISARESDDVFVVAEEAVVRVQ